MKALWLFLLLSSCGIEAPCYDGRFENVTHYPVNPNHITASGVKVDDVFGVDLVVLDERVRKIEDCLVEVAETVKVMKPEWECITLPEPKPFNRDCLVIKVVAPIYSSCSDWQFIDALAPQELCDEKGLTATPECPCRWRTAIQDNNVIITPPALYLWDLVRIYTSCNMIWDSPFAVCADY